MRNSAEWLEKYGLGVLLAEATENLLGNGQVKSSQRTPPNLPYEFLFLLPPTIVIKLFILHTLVFSLPTVLQFKYQHYNNSLHSFYCKDILHAIYPFNYFCATSGTLHRLHSRLVSDCCTIYERFLYRSLLLLHYHRGQADRFVAAV